MKKYLITLNTHFRFLLSSFLYIIIPIIIVIPLVIYIKRDSFDVDIAFIIGFWGIVILITPKLLIYLNYFLTNRSMIIYHDEQKQQLRVKDKGCDVTFLMSDIQSVTEYKTYPKAENRTTWFPWDEYHYSLVELKSGEKFYFTSLILPNLNLPIDISKVSVKKRFYPAIW